MCREKDEDGKERQREREKECLIGFVQAIELQWLSVRWLNGRLVL